VEGDLFAIGKKCFNFSIIAEKCEVKLFLFIHFQFSVRALPPSIICCVDLLASF
jgi:hypothetical protein